MQPIIYMILAGLLGALSNFCLKSTLEKKGSAQFFFIMQLFLTFLIATCLCPVGKGEYSWNTYTVVIAVVCGLFLGMMKLMISKALKEGASSLTFAAVNCASVMPALILALIFGALTNFEYTFMNLAGTILVFIGLIWATKRTSSTSNRRAWLIFACGAFAFQFLYLFFTQTHFIIVKNKIFSFGVHSEWFFPFVFAAAAALHFGVYFINERRFPSGNELFWGILGGFLNGACAFLFMQATELAAGTDNTFIFPLFSVTLIVACNLWGAYFYREPVNWLAHSLCISGLIIGMI